jgi:sugar O-acyltransferase (sialic acid O-acetyltransferase NeuD family)
MVVIGYSGHAFVVCGILQSSGSKLSGYCDTMEKEYNPFHLAYLGSETSVAALQVIEKQGCFIAVGDNTSRRKIHEQLTARGIRPSTIAHPSAVVDATAQVSEEGVMLSARVTINPLARIGVGAICNTGCIIEHECEVGDFAHIGPGAVLCGNVKIGAGSFVGANAVIRQGIHVGSGAMIGAGAVVVKDVPDNCTVMGVPAK